jgi:signal transduction histidine kinase
VAVATVPTSATGPSPSEHADGQRRWRAVAIGVAVFAAFYVLAPVTTTVRDSVTLVTDLGAVALIVLGIHRYRPATPYAWGLIAGGILAWGIGDALWLGYTLAGDDPFPSPADLFYLAGYPLVAAGLLVGIRWRTPRRDVRVLIDAGIVTVSATAVGWVYVAETWSAEESAFDGLVAAAYPLADVLLCAIAVRLALGGGWRNVRSLQLLLLAVGMTFLGDFLFALDEIGDLGLTRLSDALLVIAIPVFGLAAFHPTMVALTEEAPTPPAEPSVERMLFLSAFVLVPAVIIVVQSVQGETRYLPVAAAATFLLGALMIMRFADLAAGARRAAAQEAVVSRFASELLASAGRAELYRHAERTAQELVGGRTARVVEPDQDDVEDYAFAAPIAVRGEVVAHLVADVDPQGLARRRNVLSTIAAELSLALEREELLDGERAAARALAEQNERLQEIDRLKDQFVSTVSHELRTPLAAVIGYLELVREGEAGELNEVQARFLDVVHRNADRLHTLVDDILEIAKMDAEGLTLHPAEVDLVELVVSEIESTHAAAERKGVEVRFEEPDEPCVLSADRKRLVQVLGNLLSNAIKFTPEGGSVTLSLDREGDAAVLEVADTGVGIPADEVEKLFGRFFRASTATTIRGTGLGLSIVKSIVEAHGGTLGVRSTVGVGTTFTIGLPLGVAPEAEVAPAEAQA